LGGVDKRITTPSMKSKKIEGKSCKGGGNPKGVTVVLPFTAFPGLGQSIYEEA